MKNIWKNKKGFTLVEAIVAFGLTAVFITAASMVLSVFMKTYVQVQSTARAQNVAGTLMEEIVGDLEGASEVNIAVPGVSYVSVYLKSDGSVWFANYEHQVIRMYVDENRQLALEYQGTGHYASKTKWRYQDGFYNGCEIGRLAVTKVPGKNLLNVSLTVQNTSAEVSYTMERMLECYNLDESEILAE